MSQQTSNAIAISECDRRILFDFDAAFVSTLEVNQIEIDSTGNGIYRVWNLAQLLGTFHRSPIDGKWLANPICGFDYNRYDTSDEAQAAIVDVWNQRAASEVAA